MKTELSKKKTGVPSAWFRKNTDPEWEKHIKEMSHPDYPYRVVHWKAIAEYEERSANSQRRPGGIFGLYEGGIMHNDFCSVIETPNEIRGIFEKIVTKREDLRIKKYLPHFITIKNPASMYYLLSCPRLECHTDGERALRTQIAQHIQCQNANEHPDNLWATTHFHSKFWADDMMEGFGGFLTYGLEIINPSSRKEDICETRAYEGNCRRIRRLVSDTYKFCNIVRADSDPDEKWGNGYQKLERTIGRQIDDLARAIAQSSSPNSMVYFANLNTSNQNPTPQLPNQRYASGKGLISKIRGLLE